MHDKSVQKVSRRQSGSGVNDRCCCCKIGVSHGDLNKLDNIMWDNHSAQPYLIDFELACWLEDRVNIV